MAKSARLDLDPVVALLDGLAELVELGNAGVSGLPGIQLTLDLAHSATGALGGVFIEYTPSGGRIVASTHDFQWALGRPVLPTDPAVVRLLAGPPVQDLPVGELSAGGRRLLGAHGVHRVMVALAVDQGVVVGALYLGFADQAGHSDGYQRGVLRLLAACAAQLYRESAGLPAYPHPDALTPLTQGLAVVGPDSTVRSWSPSAARLTGRSFADVIGQPLTFPVPAIGQALVHRLDAGRWVRARATPLTGTDSIVVTFRETAEPRAEEQARDLFIAVTSHELRTPVTVIRGYADTLAERWDSLDEATRREAVFVVGQRARELARLVDRLLTAATDNSGLFDPGLGTPFDLADALRDAVAELSAGLRSDLDVTLPGDLPQANGDRSNLATILTELVTNATKYSPGAAEVELTAGADEQTVWFRVADRGSGIRPEHVEQAFERFWQLDRGEQRRSGGVGLGLYLVRRLVERQNGWVSLRPRAGGGTVAEVRLPRAELSVGEA